MCLSATLVYTDIGGNIVHRSRLYRANFSYAENDDLKYSLKSLKKSEDSFGN